MEIDISAQLALAAVSVLSGAGLGLWYDALRLPRLLLPGWLTTFFCDLVFCLGALLGLFTLGLGPGGGQLRLFMLLCAGAGWAVWAAVPGRFLARWEAALARFLSARAALAGQALKKIPLPGKKVKNFLKKLFPSGARWFTIIRNCRQKKRPRSPGGVRAGAAGKIRAYRGDHYEIQAFGDCRDCHRAGAGGVRRNPSDHAAAPDRRRPGKHRGAP